MIWANSGQVERSFSSTVSILSTTATINGGSELKLPREECPGPASLIETADSDTPRRSDLHVHVIGCLFTFQGNLLGQYHLLVRDKDPGGETILSRWDLPRGPTRETASQR